MKMKKIEIHGMGEDQEVLRKLENEFFINVILPHPLRPKTALKGQSLGYLYLIIIVYEQ